MAPRWNSLTIRLALPVALVGLTALGAATPAHAAPEAERPTVELSVPDRVVTTPGGSKTVQFEVQNTGKVPAIGLVLEFASAGGAVDPRLGFQPPAGCTATGCTVGDLAPGVRKPYTFTVKPTAELPATGAALRLAVHDAAAEWQVETTVTVLPAAAPGIDLETARIPDIKLAPGTSAVLPISVRNNGNKATEGVAVALAVQPGVHYPNKYSNCVDAADLPGIICAFDLTLEPGAVFTVSPATPLTVEAGKDTPGPASYYAGLHAYGIEDDADVAGLAAAKRAMQQPGTKLQLVPAVQSLAVDQRELNEWDNTTSFFVKVPLNQADSAAIGDNFEGKVGDTRTIKVGIRNNGPATVLPRTKEWWHAARVRIPSGLKLTKVDKNCVPNGDGEPSWNLPGQVSGHDYLCVTSEPLAAGKTELFAFTAKIQDGRNEDEGSITVLGGVQDSKPGNNVAKIEVKLTNGNTGGAGGGLPITGGATGQVAATGLLLVLLGAFTLLLTRRRPTA
ncbi:hypothetical protein [Actinoplanes sp. NPDC049599]|uniref:hypothetical protein n=1 Tax=Actinoplanes sp. NPDC049599 TaxID=3363903 RepID=UPI003790B1D3